MRLAVVKVAVLAGDSERNASVCFARQSLGKETLLCRCLCSREKTNEHK